MGQYCVVKDLKTGDARRVCALHRKSSYMHPEKTHFGTILEFNKNTYEKILNLRILEGCTTDWGVAQPNCPEIL